MEKYLKTLIERQKELNLRKMELEDSLVPVIAELIAVENLISVAGGEVYPRTSILKEKIVFVLSKIGEGSYLEIGEYMKKCGDEANNTSLKITCASMSRSGEIKILKTEGRTNIYEL